MVPRCVVSSEVLVAEAALSDTNGLWRSSYHDPTFDAMIKAHTFEFVTDEFTAIVRVRNLSISSRLRTVARNSSSLSTAFDI